MTAPTLDDVRAWLRECERQLRGLQSCAADAADRLSWEQQEACARLALAALDDAERWRAVRLDGSVHAQSFTATPHNTMTETAQSIHVVAGPVAGTYADMWADHLRDAARREGA